MSGEWDPENGYVEGVGITPQLTREQRAQYAVEKRKTLHEINPYEEHSVAFSKWASPDQRLYSKAREADPHKLLFSRARQTSNSFTPRPDAAEFHPMANTLSGGAVNGSSDPTANPPRGPVAKPAPVGASHSDVADVPRDPAVNASHSDLAQPSGTPVVKLSDAPVAKTSGPVASSVTSGQADDVCADKPNLNSAQRGFYEMGLAMLKKILKEVTPPMSVHENQSCLLKVERQTIKGVSAGIITVEPPENFKDWYDYRCSIQADEFRSELDGKFYCPAKLSKVDFDFLFPGFNYSTAQAWIRIDSRSLATDGGDHIYIKTKCDATSTNLMCCGQIGQIGKEFFCYRKYVSGLDEDEMKWMGNEKRGTFDSAAEFSEDYRIYSKTPSFNGSSLDPTHLNPVKVKIPVHGHSPRATVTNIPPRPRNHQQENHTLHPPKTHNHIPGHHNERQQDPIPHPHKASPTSPRPRNKRQQEQTSHPSPSPQGSSESNPPKEVLPPAQPALPQRLLAKIKDQGFTPLKISSTLGLKKPNLLQGGPRPTRTSSSPIPTPQKPTPPEEIVLPKKPGLQSTPEPQRPNPPFELPTPTRSDQPSPKIRDQHFDGSYIIPFTTGRKKPVQANIARTMAAATVPRTPSTTLQSTLQGAVSRPMLRGKSNVGDLKIGSAKIRFGTEKDPNTMLQPRGHVENDIDSKMPLRLTPSVKENLGSSAKAVVEPEKNTTIAASDNGSTPKISDIAVEQHIPERPASSTTSQVSPSVESKLHQAVKKQVEEVASEKDATETCSQGTSSNGKSPGSRTTGTSTSRVALKFEPDQKLFGENSETGEESSDANESAVQKFETRPAGYIPPHLRGVSVKNLQNNAPNYCQQVTANDTVDETPDRDSAPKDVLVAASPASVVTTLTVEENPLTTEGNSAVECEVIPLQETLDLVSTTPGDSDPTPLPKPGFKIPPHLQGVVKEQLRVHVPSWCDKVYPVSTSPSMADNDSKSMAASEDKVPVPSIGRAPKETPSKGLPATQFTSKAPSSTAQQSTPESAVIEHGIAFSGHTKDPHTSEFASGPFDKLGVAEHASASTGDADSGCVMEKAIDSQSVEGTVNEDSHAIDSPVDLSQDEIEKFRDYHAEVESSKKAFEHIEVVFRHSCKYSVAKYEKSGEHKFRPRRVDWDSSMSHVNNGARHLKFMDDWMEFSLKEAMGKTRRLIMESNKFTTGEWIATGEHHMLFPPIPEVDMAGTEDKDLMTIQQLEQTSEDCSVEFRKQVYDDKRQRRLERENLRWSLENRRKNPPAPLPEWVPSVNTYTRPSEPADAAQIAMIFNSYIKTSNTAVETEEVTQGDIRQRIDTATDERLPFVVAIGRGDCWRDINTGKPVPVRGNKSRMVQAPECVIGFAWAEDFAGRNTSLGNTAELFCYVHPNFAQMGVATTMIDRIMPGLDQTYEHHRGCEFVAEDTSLYEVGGVRDIHRVVIQIGYASTEEDILKWKSDWLAKRFGFVQTGTLPGVGFKNNKRYSLAHFVKETYIVGGKSMWPA
ncbi:MAG: hypothetical protein MMC33_005437 [Icmadophila ericetorum]|nr:hypothetical protein [Icmadophila ericetorum]